MKKLFVLVVVVAMIFSFSGCGDSQAEKDFVKVLTTSEYWYHFDEVTGENEKMSFGEDEEFYWGCECGEPIGDSDLLELYEFDAGDGVIKLYNDFDDYSMDVEVLDYSDYHLLLKVDGKIKDYTSALPDVKGALNVDDTKQFLTGYSGEFHTISGDADSVVLTHFDYDGDVEYPENAFKEYTFADDVEFCSLTANTHIVDGQVVSHNEDFTEIDKESAIVSMEGGAAFVWFNDNLEISKMMFYGSVISEE